MNIYPVIVDGEAPAPVGVSETGQIICKACETWACRHVDAFIASGGEQEELWRLLGEGRKLLVTVPLFSFDDLRSAVPYRFGHGVEIEPAVGPAGRYAKLLMPIPNEPAAGVGSYADDTISRGGSTFAKLGVVLPTQGISSIRYAMSSWVKTQITDTELECQSMFHGAAYARHLEQSLKDSIGISKWNVILVLRGICADCMLVTEDASGDVPEARNVRRYRRLRSDFQWLKQMMREMGADPEDARFLL